MGDQDKHEPSELLERIPSSDEIRERIKQLTKERSTLRGLLKIAISNEARQQAMEGGSDA